MKTEWEKRKLPLFMGSLAVVALVINCFFYRPPGPAIRYQMPTVSTPSMDHRQETDNEVERERSRREAARKAAEQAAIDHTNFLTRYVNGATRTPGMKSIALVAAAEDGRLNAAVGTALATRFKGDSVDVLSSYFKPEFVSDRLFDKVFDGSVEVLTKLEVTNSLDGLLLARQSVKYTKNPNLLDVLTANMQLEVQFLPIGGNIQRRSWAFTANGAGFKQEEARALAEERLIKQITTDTRMSFN